jgi:hypothetical protein
MELGSLIAVWYGVCDFANVTTTGSKSTSGLVLLIKCPNERSEMLCFIDVGNQL